jgi:hypothetical protein
VFTIDGEAPFRGTRLENITSARRISMLIRIRHWLMEGCLVAAFSGAIYFLS